tara:strand:+ start:279 stop:815 length:537 start_codon:yes stop_codon:yes gene_type:complete
MKKKNPKSYCDYVANLDKDSLHKVYHDNQYGFAINNDDELFGRLILEINQAGLSWTTILVKQNNFRKAYSGFSIQKISKYGEHDINRLLSNSGIIRNRLKVSSVIYNAQKTLLLQKEFRSFRNWLEKNKGKKLEEWIKLFKNTFKFTGGQITKEFLISTGMFKGAHTINCPIFHKINQ